MHVCVCVYGTCLCVYTYYASCVYVYACMVWYVCMVHMCTCMRVWYMRLRVHYVHVCICTCMVQVHGVSKAVIIRLVSHEERENGEYNSVIISPAQFVLLNNIIYFRCVKSLPQRWEATYPHCDENGKERFYLFGCELRLPPLMTRALGCASKCSFSLSRYC